MDRVREQTTMNEEVLRSYFQVQDLVQTKIIEACLNLQWILGHFLQSF